MSLPFCGTISQYRAEQDFDIALGLFNQGRYEDAIPHFRKAIEAEPGFVKAYLCQRGSRRPPSPGKAV